MLGRSARLIASLMRARRAIYGGCLIVALAACAQPNPPPHSVYQAVDQALNRVAAAAEISVAADRRDFRSAALQIGTFLKEHYSEVAVDTRACEDAINGSDSAVLQTACGLDSAIADETPGELTKIAMGRMALGQFFLSGKAVQMLQATHPTDGAAQLSRALAPDPPAPVFAVTEDLVRGGPIVVAHMAVFDHAVAAAESGDWAKSCAALDRAIPTLPDYRTVHLLRFVICARANEDRSQELASFGALADHETQVFTELLLRKVPPPELLGQLKVISPGADAYIERHYYSAQVAYLVGDQTTYLDHLNKIARAKDLGFFEQRLTHAELARR